MTQINERRKILALSLVIFSGVALPQLASAQQHYPAKPIDIIVPFAAGGSTDLTARVSAKALQDKWKVQVRVVNQTGGNGLPAISSVMQASPDGYTVLMDGTSSSSALPLVVDNLPFKIEDRTFITLTSQTPMVYLVAGPSPHRTLECDARIKKDSKTFLPGHQTAVSPPVTPPPPVTEGRRRAGHRDTPRYRAWRSRGRGADRWRTRRAVDCVIHLRCAVSGERKTAPPCHCGEGALCAYGERADRCRGRISLDRGDPVERIFRSAQAAKGNRRCMARGDQTACERPRDHKVARAGVGLEPRTGDGKAMADVVSNEQKLYTTYSARR